jgi:hypothetical protein
MLWLSTAPRHVELVRRNLNKGGDVTMVGTETKFEVSNENERRNENCP